MNPTRRTHPSLASLASGFLLACLAAPAATAPLTLPATISPGNGLQWMVWNDIGNGPRACAGAAPGFGFEDAGFALPPAGPGPNDAYDGGFLISIDGMRFRDTDGIVDLTGNTLTAGPSTMSGLNVSVQHYYSATSQLARIMAFLQNPGTSSITATVSVTTNFGSDGATVARATSSGDTAVSLADRWLITSDGGPSDEINTLVMYGPGAPLVTPSAYSTVTPFTCAGTQGLVANYTVTVPAQSTRSLMFFGGIGGITTPDNTLASAQSAATLFDSNATLMTDWLTGLDTTQRSQIVNWSFPLPPPACSGLTGAKLTLCRQICEFDQSPTNLANLLKLFRAIYRTDPPCVD